MLEVSTCTLQLPTPPSPPKQQAADQQQQQFVGSFVGDHAGCFPTSATDDGCFMVDDADSLLLDYIDFSTCDVVPFFDADGDVLPDLEADPTELLAEFPSSPEPEDYYDNPNPSRASPGPAAEDPPDVHKQDDLLLQQPATAPMMTIVLEDKKAADEEKPWLLEATNNNKEEEEKEEAVTTTSTTAAADQAEEDYSTTTGPGGAAADTKSSSAASAEGHHHSHSKKKPAAAGNNSSHAGKRKVKVDWTPELHRRFVQAVEQLGIDKAVPSRILEIMGIQCLTRHNIASHLQKYRSHRKHLMAREAEAASWAQKRQMYAGAGAGTAAPARNVSSAAAAAVPRPWVVPTIGFPPPPAAAPFCRPLHVWGHPPTTGAAAVEAGAAAPPTPTTMLLPLPVWPRHLAPPPRPTWAHPPPVDPAYWHQHYSAARKWGPPQPAAAVTQGTPVPVPPPMPRFPVPGMVPHPIPMYTPPPPPPPPPPQQQQQQSSSKLAELQLQLDAHPSKESIDAAIGDVLVKPWLPLPLGLKPPSVDSVMSELHKQGIPKVPPAATD